MVYKSQFRAAFAFSRVIWEWVFTVYPAVVVTIRIDDIIHPIQIKVPSWFISVKNAVSIAVRVKVIGNGVVVIVTLNLLIVREPVHILVTGRQNSHSYDG